MSNWPAGGHLGAACLRRVRTLEELGYIRGYHADIDARELGFEVQVFAMVPWRRNPNATCRPSRHWFRNGRWSANATC